MCPYKNPIQYLLSLKKYLLLLSCLSRCAPSPTITNPRWLSAIRTVESGNRSDKNADHENGTTGSKWQPEKADPHTHWFDLKRGKINKYRFLGRKQLLIGENKIFSSVGKFLKWKRKFKAWNWGSDKKIHGQWVISEKSGRKRENENSLSS